MKTLGEQLVMREVEMKQAWEQYYADYGYDYRKIDVLPKCKKVYNPQYDTNAYTEYQLVRSKVFFGLFPITYWLDKNYIKWTDMPTVEYYDCDNTGL